MDFYDYDMMRDYLCLPFILLSIHFRINIMRTNLLLLFLLINIGKFLLIRLIFKRDTDTKKGFKINLELLICTATVFKNFLIVRKKATIFEKFAFTRYVKQNFIL
jgi:hypothetical protein